MSRVFEISLNLPSPCTVRSLLKRREEVNFDYLLRRGGDMKNKKRGWKYGAGAGLLKRRGWGG